MEGREPNGLLKSGRTVDKPTNTPGRVSTGGGTREKTILKISEEEREGRSGRMKSFWKEETELPVVLQGA